MTDIQMADTIVHIDEELGAVRREDIRDIILNQPGVVAAVFHDDKPHILNLGYDPKKITSQALLALVTDQGVHAELIGL